MNIDLPAKFWRSRECTRVLAHTLLSLDGIWGVYICLLTLIILISVIFYHKTMPRKHKHLQEGPRFAVDSRGMWKAQEVEPEKPESSEPKEAVAWQQNLLILLDSPSVTVQFDLKLYTFDWTQFIACSFKCTLYNTVYNDTDILYTHIYILYI